MISAVCALLVGFLLAACVFDRRENGYGKDRYHFDGESLPSLMRKALRTTLPDVRNQTPRVIYAEPDRPRFYAPEYVRKFMKVVRRAS